MASDSPADPAALAPEAIAALAHPLRSRLLVALRRVGSASATDLAAELGTNSGATSYHLRRLAAAGLVEEAAGGRGRQRLWRATSPRHSWMPSDAADDPDAASTLGWIEHDYVRHVAETAESWLGVADGWPVEWRDHLGMRDHVALVTQEQLAAMSAEITEVIERYRRVGQGNPTAKRIAVYTYSYPVDMDRPPLR